MKFVITNYEDSTTIHKSVLTWNLLHQLCMRQATFQYSWLPVVNYGARMEQTDRQTVVIHYALSQRQGHIEYW